jgi:hypothetical protein
LKSKHQFGGALKKTLITLLILVIVITAFLFWRVGEVEVIKPGSPPVNDLDIAKAPVEFSIVTYNVQARPWFDDSHHKFKYMSPL